MQSMAETFRPGAGAAENQSGKLHFLVMGQIADGAVQIAPVAGKLLGRDRQQLGGRGVVRVSGAGKSIQIQYGLAPKPGAEILPADAVIAQFSGHQTGLQHGIQLHPQGLRGGPGGPAQAALLAEDDQGILRHIVHGAGKLRINQGHIPVGSGICNAVFVFFQVGGQGFQQ